MSRSTRVSPWAEGLPFLLLKRILGLLLMIAGVAFLLSLMGGDMGVAGRETAAGLRIVFGAWIAGLTPAFLFLFGLNTARARRLSWGRALASVAGVLMCVSSLCALSTLFAAQGVEDPSRRFYAGGVMGAFLVVEEGLGLGKLLGPVGAALFFGALFLAGAILFVELQLKFVLRAGGAAIRGLQGGKWREWLSRDEAEEPANPAMDRLRALRESPAPSGNRPFWRRAVEWPLRFTAYLFLPRRPPVIFPHLTSSTAGPRILDRVSTPIPPSLREKSERKRGPRKTASEDSDADSPGASTLFELEKEDATAAEQLEMFPDTSYEPPSMELLNLPPRGQARISNDEILETSMRLEQTLAEFNIEARVVQVVQGPVVTRYEMQPAPGVKVNRIAGLERELAMALLAEQVRIQAPIPGKAAIGVEAPNKQPNAVTLREILQHEAFETHASPLAFGLGKDISGEPLICDLATMPHLLIAGATGAGKSVCLNAIIISFLMRMSPDQVKFIMVDPKRVELAKYQDIPHLLAPVVVDPRKAAGALSWTVHHMEERYRKMERLKVRNIAGYNKRIRHALDHGRALPGGIDPAPMPYIVVVVDELADLMVVARSEVEETIQRLAQMSRAVGIHLILATQRPSVNVITGVIKANLPARVAFRVTQKVDSRTILDANGAEALIGRGDMLYAPGGGRLYRVQGAFVSDSEVERIADRIREQAPPRYEKEDFAAARAGRGRERGAPASSMEGDDGVDYDTGEASDEDLYLRALRLVLETKKASVSLIQRRLKIGYARAGRLMDLMEEAGVVGPYQGSKPRDLLVSPEQYMAQLQDEGLLAADPYAGE